MNAAAWRLVSFGNARLLGRYAGGGSRRRRFRAASRAGLPMLWNAWRADYTGAWRTRASEDRVPRQRGFFALPRLAVADLAATQSRLDDILAEAAELAPDDAPAFERARAALRADDPERLVPAEELPMLAPATHPAAARRLMAAVYVARQARAFDPRHDDFPVRPADFGATLQTAVLAAVNALA